MNYFAKFEKFLPHRIIIPSFMTVGSQIPKLDRLAFMPLPPPPPPHKLDSQNTLDKLGLSFKTSPYRKILAKNYL